MRQTLVADTENNSNGNDDEVPIMQLNIYIAFMKIATCVLLMKSPNITQARQNVCMVM